LSGRPEAVAIPRCQLCSVAAVVLATATFSFYGFNDGTSNRIEVERLDPKPLVWMQVAALA